MNSRQHSRASSGRWRQALKGPLPFVAAGLVALITVVAVLVGMSRGDSAETELLGSGANDESWSPAPQASDPLKVQLPTRFTGTPAPGETQPAPTPTATQRPTPGATPTTSSPTPSRRPPLTPTPRVTSTPTPTPTRTTSTPRPTPSVSKLTVSLEIVGDRSHVGAKREDGSFLAERRTYLKGEKLNFRAEPYVRLVLGRREAVRILVNGVLQPTGTDTGYAELIYRG